MSTHSLPSGCEVDPRPAAAPPYYQGRPATFWINAMRKSAVHADGNTDGKATIPAPRPRPATGTTVPPTPRLSAARWMRGGLRLRFRGPTPRCVQRSAQSYPSSAASVLG